MKRKKWIALPVTVAATAAAGVLTGIGVLSATASSESPGQSAAAALERNGLGARIATFAAGNGAPERGVYLAQLEDGRTCLMDADAGGRTAGGGCSRGDDALDGEPFSATFMYDGGPDPSSVTDARLAGLVAPSVARIFAVMSNGSTRTLPLSEKGVASTSYRVFAFRVSRGDLRNGVTPTAIVAYDRQGTELARQSTGLAK